MLELLLTQMAWTQSSVPVADGVPGASRRHQRCTSRAALTYLFESSGVITAGTQVKPGTWPVGSLAVDQQCCGLWVVTHGRCSCMDSSQARTATLPRRFDRWLPPQHCTPEGKSEKVRSAYRRKLKEPESSAQCSEVLAAPERPDREDLPKYAGTSGSRHCMVVAGSWTLGPWCSIGRG